MKAVVLEKFVTSVLVSNGKSCEEQSSCSDTVYCYSGLKI